jgi:hypothetical protein
MSPLVNGAFNSSKDISRIIEKARLGIIELSGVLHDAAPTCNKVSSFYLSYSDAFNSMCVRSISVWDVIFLNNGVLRSTTLWNALSN